MPMTPERHKRVRAIYEGALEKDPAEHNAFIDLECQGDEEIRREVELLLDTRNAMIGWLSEPLLDSAGSIAASLAALPPPMEGRQLSGYKLIKEIGSGGMGSVYLAERYDGTFQKRVAIKLIRPGLNGSEILDRFRREREILASLDHPNIARLIDGGTTEDGLPYFVMEFVDGQPIHRWCDERKLNVSERLKLFRSVCAAVQYAHQRLVVHRDLKPSNILVTADGTVKLLDFGIAKVLAPAQMRDAAPTVSRLMAMTPEYASPEQLKADGITTLSDVYSLGVVLYEVLTGHRPYRLIHAAMHEIARVISEEEPTRPSLVVGTTEQEPEGEAGMQPITPETVSAVREGNLGRLRKRLEGDLDSILLTALRKEPARRYSSVEAFGEDLRRHLDNRPVSAREDSLLYRASRFVRRHPGGVVAAILIVLSMVAGMLTTLWEGRIVLEANRQRLTGRAILAPQIAIFAYMALALFGAAAFLSRARARRIAGAVSGGALFALVWLLKWKIDYSMGWWRSAFPETPDPTALFSMPVIVPLITLGAAAFLFGSWRVARRFGWVGWAVVILPLAASFSVRDRFYWDTFMRVMVATPGIRPVVADAAFFAAGLAAGHALMRLVAGPARLDRLARTR
jgi:serine/threonine protein kinase